MPALPAASVSSVQELQAQGRGRGVERPSTLPFSSAPHVREGVVEQGRADETVNVDGGGAFEPRK